MIPTQIGPYLILDKIGAGGMGSVYLGHLADSAEQVAIKVLPASLAHEEGFVERFNREIESMKRLSNPHIVRLIDSGVDNGTYYYSMEFVPGETLTNLLRREKKVTWDKAVDIGLQICTALKAAHDAGIIHRDLKPSNLLVTPEGFIKLTDFGVAQVFATDRLTVTGGIVGTAEFMSPEQAQGQRASKQSDLYSLGAVLYALVCGRPPFTGRTAVDVLQKHRYGRFDAPRLVNPEIPAWLEEIINQLLEKDPAKRFPDAFVVFRKLEQVRAKYALSEGDATVVEGYAMRDTGPTLAAEATLPAEAQGRAGPGPATLMKHLVREELEESFLPHWVSQLFNSAWFLAAMLLLVVTMIVLWSWPQTLSQKEMFARGQTLMTEPEGSGWTDAGEKYFKPLLKLDPKTWEPQVAPYLNQIDIYTLKQSLKTPKLRDKLDVEDNSIAEPYRWLALAQQQLREGDEIAAEVLLRDVSTLLKDDPQQSKLYDLATRLHAELQQRRAKNQDRYAWVQTALTRAVHLEANGKPEQAQAIRAAILRLYGNDPQAQSLLKRARQGEADPTRKVSSSTAPSQP